MTTTSALVGRAVELDQFNDLLTGIEDQGRAVVVLGDPGIGKSSLLHEVASAARARGMTVLETTGVESESGLPYAGLHRLLMPLMGGAERLPETQRRALFTAIGIEDGPAPQIFLVALATLTLLTETRHEARPVVAVIDDIQWLDACQQRDAGIRCSPGHRGPDPRRGRAPQRSRGLVVAGRRAHGDGARSASTTTRLVRSS